MPSAQHLQEKQTVIDEIKGKLDRANAAVVIDYIGINVAEADAMRKRLREADVDYKVYKNTLVKRAIVGTNFAELEKALSGPSAFAFGFEDAIAPARVLSGIIKDTKKMEFKAGIIEGTFYDAEGLKVIASLPTKDELIGRFLGSIQSPVSKLVRTFKAVADAMEDGTLGSVKADAAPQETADAKAADAEVKAEAPDAKAADTEVKAEAPEAKAANAEVKAEAPEAKVANAEVKAEAPEAKAADAEVKAEVPEAKATDAEVKAEAPETKE